jgi:hypothetical protein
MLERREFHPLQAEEIARAFNEKGVDYLFIGKSGAILLGYPGTTQDVREAPGARTSLGLGDCRRQPRPPGLDCLYFTPPDAA